MTLMKINRKDAKVAKERRAIKLERGIQSLRWQASQHGEAHSGWPSGN